MQGSLFVYDEQRKLVAFEAATTDRHITLLTGNHNKNNSHGSEDEHQSGHLVFIGGLTDGLMAVPYLAPLQKALNLGCCHLKLVQVLLSSSYCGYGTSSLHQDVQELDLLIEKLVYYLFLSSLLQLQSQHSLSKAKYLPTQVHEKQSKFIVLMGYR